MSLDVNVAVDAIRNHFDKMGKENDYLYVVDLGDKSLFWNMYLDAIPPQHNKIYKTRREYDCVACHHFINRVGPVVAIKDGTIESIWDVVVGDPVWQSVFNKLADFVRDKPLTDVYLTKEEEVGIERSTGHDALGNVFTFRHFYVEVPSKWVFNDRFSTLDSELSKKRSLIQVFSRCLSEITLDAVDAVYDLIQSDTLYRGNEYLKIVEMFRKHKVKYDSITDERAKELYAWKYGLKVPESVASIRNTSIGTLLTDISDGEDMEVAVKKYEAKVAPANYKRSKPIFTQRMLDDAKKTIEELGYTDSLRRRYATVEDIKVSNVLYANRTTSRPVFQDTDDVFAALSTDVKKTKKKFDKVEEVPVQTFVTEYLPKATDLEVYFEGRHEGNLMSLIAPVVKDSKTMFQWDNNFSWAYTGNVTDSVIRERVKAAGGKVDGVLRFSIQWNDIPDDWNQNDEDAHCITPNGTRIYYGYLRDRVTGGNLDVDIRYPKKGIPAVENITWPSLERMTPGKYTFMVHTFAGRGGNGGFRAEIEFDGQIFSFDYNMKTINNKTVEVAEVTLDKNGHFTIREILPSTNVSGREIWGLHTNGFVPVSMVCYSPNYWDNNAVGNKHYFFLLKDCVNPESPNGYYNEFLNGELYPTHRKVMEALGSRLHVEECENQLSGLGFSSTLRNDLVVSVTVDGKKRVYRIKF